jgi:hypothetical protein
VLALDDRRSYHGFAGSFALHGTVLALILLGLAAAPKFADSPNAVPIETVSLSDVNEVMNGEKDAKPAPPSAASTPSPPEMPPQLRASQEPQAASPPQATPPEKPQPPEPAKAETQPPSPEPPPRPEPAKPDAAPPEKLAVGDEAPIAPPVRPKTAETPPERPKVAEAAPEKPKQPDKPKEPDRPKPTHPYDPSAIAKLIGQPKPTTAAAPPAQTASLAPQGLPHHEAQRMSLSMAAALDAWLTESYLNCWIPPPAMPEGDTYVAQIKVVFNADGSLSGRPVLLNPPTDPAWRAHAESAMRAVRKCDPLKVPAEYMPYFDQWRVETIHFDPRETQG